MRDVAVVINARLASSRCPRKLVRRFGDSTLLDIALEKLSLIECNEKYLAAGDEEIINLFKKANHPNIQVLHRNKDSVAPGEHSHRVSFRHYADVKSSFIMIMNPCMPFTQLDTYNNAIKFFQSNKDILTMTSCKTFKDVFFNSNGEVITLTDKNHISTVTADKMHKMAHLFHIINRETFCESGILWKYEVNDPYLYEVPEHQCFDVDTEDDFIFCSRIYSSLLS